VPADLHGYLVLNAGALHIANGRTAEIMQ
jgi:hypothetical protein